MAGGDSLPINLRKLPEIVQTGLCLHGARSEESFCLRGLWALHAYRYRGEIGFAGRTFPFRAGCVSITPPDTVVRWKFPVHAPHYYAHFLIPSSMRGVELVPVVSDLGERFDIFCERFEEMIEQARSDKSRAAVRLWDLLLEIARGRPQSGLRPAPVHPSLQIALSLIRDGIHDPIRVSGIARQMGVSQNHLSAIFRRAFGCTVHEFIHRSRMERALHLLRRSSLTIKSIAIEVGFPDLHHFNKVVRAETGLAPRAYRASGSGKTVKK